MLELIPIPKDGWCNRPYSNYSRFVRHIVSLVFRRTGGLTLRDKPIPNNVSKRKTSKTPRTLASYHHLCNKMRYYTASRYDAHKKPEVLRIVYHILEEL